uniref:Attacin_C domain-containing protein n=1 Tax=Anopheles albimanus TaxID=7167 RepID=A0A8W7K5S6_ANOAL
MKLYLIWILCIAWALVFWRPIDGKPAFEPHEERALQDERQTKGHRLKRQFSLNFGATHEDGYGTDVNAEALANLWKSASGNTKLEGSASYMQHFGGVGGDARDYRLKLKVVFTR